MAKTNTELSTKLAAQAPAKEKPQTPADQVRHYLEVSKNEIAIALPKHLTADRLARVALTCIRQQSTLLKCTIPSLMSCVIQSAQTGIEPGQFGHCYYIARWNNKQRCYEATWQIGYKGLIELIRRSGQLLSIAASPIYSNDKFLYRKGFNETLEHEPNFKDRGVIVGFYAYAIMKDGGRYADVMTLDEINRIKGRSTSKDKDTGEVIGPWVTDFEEMAKKTVLRRMSKLMPMSIEVQEKIAQDEAKELGFGQSYTEMSLNLGDEQAQNAQPAIELKPNPDEKQHAEKDPFAPSIGYPPDYDAETDILCGEGLELEA